MKIFSAIALMLITGAITDARAQGYPSRPVTLIAPTTAGGPPDTIGRILAERMKAPLGQPMIVENITGAGGSLGVQRVARAEPDGYTVSIGHLNTHVFSGAVYNLTFDLLKDLAPVTMLTSAPMVFVVRNGFPPNNLKELVAWMKERPRGAAFGSVGVGSPGKVWATDFQNKNGIEFQYVPYRGAAASIQDLIAGQIDIACVEASNVVAHLKGGRIKAYAVLEKKRWSEFPDIPTIDEAGAPGAYMTFWHGLWVPRGTPPEAIAKLNAAAVEALADPSVRARLAAVGQDIVPRDQQTPEALAAHQKAEIEKWWPIIKAAGIKAE
ncbi:MAG: tripartite tricarboxylate transporter substrate-binding protein [Hyphomicrobiales bacterium]|nr:tripartite tricarboxylate transporter substrate-binding protein [Alphaproteobacteria bacterium]